MSPTDKTRLAAARAVLDAIDRARMVSPATLKRRRPKIWVCAHGNKLDGEDRSACCGYQEKNLRRCAVAHLLYVATPHGMRACGCEICERALELHARGGDGSAVLEMVAELFPERKAAAST